MHALSCFLHSLMAVNNVLLQTGTAHAVGASVLSLARVVFAGIRSARHCVRRAVGLAWRITAGLCHAFLVFHSNATCAPIANPPNSAQLRGIPYHSPKLHPGPCNSVGMRPRTDRHTDTQTQTRVITIHFASSTTHAKCNNCDIVYGAVMMSIAEFTWLIVTNAD